MRKHKRQRLLPLITAALSACCLSATGETLQFRASDYEGGGVWRASVPASRVGTTVMQSAHSDTVGGDAGPLWTLAEKSDVILLGEGVSPPKHGDCRGVCFFNANHGKMGSET